MTRKELENNRQFQVTNAAIDYYYKYKGVKEIDIISIFEDACKWADKHPDAISMNYLHSWYQCSVDETQEPIWTDKHIEELFNDFYLIPKSKGSIDDGMIAIGQQKPVEWKTVDEQNLNSCLGYMSDEYLRRWLKDIVYSRYEKKPAWSEDDKAMINNLYRVIDDHIVISGDTRRMFCSWLKSLKERLKGE